MQDLYHPLEMPRRDRRTHLRQWQVGGGEGDAKSGCRQHHHGLGPAALGQQFSVPGETHTGVVDHALVDRPGHQGIKDAGQTTVAGSFQGLQDIGRVAGVQPAGRRRRAQVHRQHDEGAGRARSRTIRGLEVHAAQVQPETGRAGPQQAGVCHRYQLGLLRLLRKANH